MRPHTIAVLMMIVGCSLSVHADEAGWRTYSGTGFSISYPPGFSVDAHHEYTALGGGNAILGTAFKIPEQMAEGTNLSPDSYLSVEIFPQIDCTPKAFLGAPQNQLNMKDGSRRWLVANNTEGAAGNNYAETVYALDKSVPCIAVRYFIHTTNIANYEPGTVKPFDATQLKTVFDKMRQSLKPQGG
jgi:hypothetical protein